MNGLTEAETAALQEALDDEYRAWATYDQVLVDFGEVRPFSNIREAEARHIEALHTLFTRYGLPVPENPWPGRVDRYDSLRDACMAGVAAEVANGAMYDRLLQATRRDDIRAVLRNLRDASQQRHLPAFRRCAQGSPGGRGGAGRHRGGRERH
ncbi:MAG: ferritin-like domain-containing protein [Thiohalorhabdus sp.]